MLTEVDDSDSRPAKRLCLSDTAATILSILQERETSSFSAVADRVLESLGTADVSTPDEQRTVGRRVYDVLNVLCAIGLAHKEGKTIQFRPEGSVVFSVVSSQNEQKSRARIDLKQKMLVEKAMLLIGHRLLIQRNRGRSRPARSIQLPSIFVGFRDVGNGEVRRSLDGGQLEIVAESPPRFFSPMNVFHAVGFSVDEQLGRLAQIPQMAGLEALLFPRVLPCVDVSVKNQNNTGDPSVKAMAM
jgi:hypothetical protein